MKSFIIITAACLLLIGCSKDYKVEITSDTDWYGQVSGRSVEGPGNQTIDMDDNKGECALLVKKTDAGKLSAKIIWDGGWFINPSGETKSVSTMEPNGSIEICID